MKLVQSTLVLAALLAVAHGIVFPEFTKVDGFSTSLTYTGYIAVRNASDTHLFYMLHGPKNETTFNNTAPLIIWLEGGPGCSGVFASIGAIGPASVETFDQATGSSTYSQRGNTSWADSNNVLIIDAPIGTGYSYQDPKDSVKDSIVNAGDVYYFLLRFFEIYPDLKDNTIYILGNSFGGHMAPPLVARIMANASSGFSVKGLLVSVGWVDPINQIEYYDAVVYAAGIADTVLRDKVADIQSNILLAYLNKNAGLAGDLIDELGRVILTANPNLDMFNFRHYLGNITSQAENVAGPFIITRDIDKWANAAATRKLFQIPEGIQFAYCNQTIKKNFNKDVQTSYASFISNLIGKIKVLIVGAADDLIVPAAGISNYVHKLKVPATENINKVSKQVWTINGRLAGAAKIAGEFYFATMNGAGHGWVYNQPDRARWLLGAFMNGTKDWST